MYKHLAFTFKPLRCENPKLFYGKMWAALAKKKKKTTIQ